MSRLWHKERGTIMSDKTITLSKPQIRALVEMNIFFQNRELTIGYHQHETDGYRRVILSNFSISTSNALVRRGLFEHYNSAYIIRITPAGIAWLEQHKAEVGS